MPQFECLHNGVDLQSRRRACPACLKWYCFVAGCDNHGQGLDRREVFFFTVPHGGRTWYASCAVHKAEYVSVCRSCMHEHYQGNIFGNTCASCRRQCRACGLSYSNVNIHRCVPAAEVPADTRLSIQNYSYKPRPKFFGRSRKKLFFGIEQEVEAREVTTPKAVAREVLSLDEHKILYAKTDSSMYNGVEFVSHPMTFGWFTANYPRNMAAKLAEVADNNWQGQYTCGVHIHVSREAFTGYHLFKFVQFFLLNPEFVQSVAGRGNTCADARRGEHKVTAYEKDALLTNPDTNQITLRNGGQVRMPSGDIVFSTDAAIRAYAFAGKQHKFPWDVPPNRYVAVNLQNRATVEVRVFKGTVKFERLSAYMQFMDAVFKYTKEARWHSKNPLHGLTEVGFREFVKRFPRRYADLIHLLNGDEPWATA